MIQLSDVLKAVGPNAAIIFAAWIFMKFLQQRYDNAVDRYRGAVGDYRSNEHDDERSGNLRDQVLTYRRRCLLMGWATLTGLAAAILLILTLIIGVVDVLVPHSPVIGIVGTVTTILGFTLVIVAAVIVIAEGGVARRQVDQELSDVPELARGAAKQRGDVP